MSLTALAWIAVYVGLAVLTFVRPAYGVGLYLLTFFASPAFWWWGSPIADILGSRINLFTAILFAAAVLMHSAQAAPALTREQRLIIALLVVYALNATVIHFVNAANPPRSFNGMTMIWKQVGLLLLLMLSIRNRSDFNIFLGAILLGAFYLEFEVIVNDRGRFSAGRLEGIGAPGVGDANYLSGLMLLVPPLAAYWLFFGSRVQKVFAAVCQVFSLEVILRCNSRGAFLAMAVAGVWLLLAARGKARQYAFAGLCLGGLAALLMINDEHIIERFSSTFAGLEERDASAQGRLDYWRCAVSMISDHPIGSGAEAAFKSKRGANYIIHFVDTRKHPDGFRAVHNGYLDIAASWGVQGFAMYAAAIFVCWRSIRRVTQSARGTTDYKAAFLGACLQSALVGQLVVALFLSSFDGEWFFWCFALASAFSQHFTADSVVVSGRLPAQTLPMRPPAMAYRPSDPEAGRRDAISGPTL